MQAGARPWRDAQLDDAPSRLAAPVVPVWMLAAQLGSRAAIALEVGDEARLTGRCPATDPPLTRARNENLLRNLSGKEETACGGRKITSYCLFTYYTYSATLGPNRRR